MKERNLLSKPMLHPEPWTRRNFIKTSAGVVAAAELGLSPNAWADRPAGKPRTFNLWVLGDPHVEKDMAIGRESLGSPILQSESEQGFDWDVGICVGDFSSAHGAPDEEGGQMVVDQFARLKKHRREDVYCLCGNHDNTPENKWFRTWVDPMGENTKTSGVDSKSRPFPTEGTWERYSFQAGNLLFLILSDRNDYAPPVGRIRGGKCHGGRPPGAVTLETFKWWQDKVQSNPDKIIITAHHHMLKETTVGSGEWEGYGENRQSPKFMGKQNYHGYFPEDGEHGKGAGYLYWLADESKRTIQFTPDAQVFENYLSASETKKRGGIDFWLGGHTHSNPDDVKNGRTITEHKWGANFLNCCPLTTQHARWHCRPMTRLITFTEGSNQALARCYFHTRKSGVPQGWYAKADKTLGMSKAFKYV